MYLWVGVIHIVQLNPSKFRRARLPDWQKHVEGRLLRECERLGLAEQQFAALDKSRHENLPAPARKRIEDLSKLKGVGPVILRGEDSDLLIRSSLDAMHKRGRASRACKVTTFKFPDCGHAQALMDDAQTSVIEDYLLTDRSDLRGRNTAP